MAKNPDNHKSVTLHNFDVDSLRTRTATDISHLGVDGVLAVVDALSLFMQQASPQEIQDIQERLQLLFPQKPSRRKAKG